MQTMNDVYHSVRLTYTTGHKRNEQETKQEQK